MRGQHFTIYADGVSLWTIGGPLKIQQESLQKALKLKQAFMDKGGMKIPTERTTYAAISNSMGRKEKAGDQRTANTEMKQRPFNESRGAHLCGQQTKIRWRRTQVIMGIVVANSWEADEVTLKTLARAFLIFRVM